jgi:predicted anti-sigma-YlaC factor YlaD
MTEEHVTTWLGARFDGELDGQQLRLVDAHLAECPRCRAALADLRKVSSLLRSVPGAESLATPERFVANVGLRLSLRQRRQGRGLLETGWSLVPLGLLAIWSFLQSVFLVSELVVAAIWLGASNVALAGLLPAGLAGLLPSAAVETGASQILTDATTVTWLLWLNLVLPLSVVVLFWSWLIVNWPQSSRFRARS